MDKLLTIETNALDQVTGGASPWLAAAKRAGVEFSTEHNAPFGGLQGPPRASATYVGTEAGRRWYAVRAWNENINVGLKSPGDRRPQRNYVTDGA
jgi:hypothetical protein